MVQNVYAMTPLRYNSDYLQHEDSFSFPLSRIFHESFVVIFVSYLCLWFSVHFVVADVSGVKSDNFHISKFHIF